MIIHLFGHGGVSLCRDYQCINISLRVFANTAGCLSNHHFLSFLFGWQNQLLQYRLEMLLLPLPPLHGHMTQSWPKGLKGRSAEEFLENIFLPNV